MSSHPPRTTGPVTKHCSHRKLEKWEVNGNRDWALFFSSSQFVTNLLMMKQPNTPCELPKVNSSMLTCCFSWFSLHCESSEPGSAPERTLFSLTSAAISHGCWLSNNDCLSPCLCCRKPRPVSADWNAHICLLNRGLTHYRGPWEYEFSIKEGDRGWCRGTMAECNINMNFKIDWKNHSNKRVSPEAQCSKPESILPWAFLYPPFAPLLLHFSVLTGVQRERGAPSLGPHHSLPVVPKEAEPRTKAGVIAILHSPPPSWKPHFNLKNAPSPPHPAPPPVDRDRSECATVGYLQWEELCFYP